MQVLTVLPVGCFSATMKVKAAQYLPNKGIYPSSSKVFYTVFPNEDSASETEPSISSDLWGGRTGISFVLTCPESSIDSL